MPEDYHDAIAFRFAKQAKSCSSPVQLQKAQKDLHMMHRLFWADGVFKIQCVSSKQICISMKQFYIIPNSHLT